MIDIPYDIWIEGEMIEEVEALRTEVTKLKNRIEVYELAEKAYIEVGEKLEKKNEQLREALKQANPLHLEDVCGYCIFCGNEIDEEEYGHTDDCEYVKLCGGQ